MSTVTIHQAKTQLSKLIQQAIAGEDVVIAKGNTPMVRLVPVEAKKQRSMGIGAWKHMEPIPDSVFFGDSGDELGDWENNDLDPSS